MGAVDTQEVLIANSQFGGGATTWAPATWYVGLSTTTPNEDGTGFTEPVGGSYARVAVTNNTTNWPAATTSSGVTSKANGTVIQFTNPTGTYFNPLDASISPKSGNSPVQFDVGALVLFFE
jgi:hypothetical protein